METLKDYDQPFRSNAKNGAKRRRQLAKLYRLQGGLCYWCKRKMILVTNGIVPKRKVFNPMEATLEHLDSRFSQERGKHPNEFRRVAACRECNVSRGIEEAKRIPIEQLRERARRVRGE